MDDTLFFDVETTTKNKGNPFTKSNFLVSLSFAVGSSDPQFHYYREPDFLQSLQVELQRCKRIVGINLKFDLHWIRRAGLQLPEDVEIWDCALAEHIMSGQRSVFPSMDQMCDLYGIPNKNGGLEEYWNAGIDTPDIPYDAVKTYNNDDITRTRAIYSSQLNDIRLKKTTNLEKLILIDGQDLLVLEDMEYNGIKYDTEGSRTLAGELTSELLEVTAWFHTLAGTSKLNLDSGDHLSAFLFGGSFETAETQTIERVYKTGPRAGQVYTVNATISRETIKFDGFFNPIPGTELKKSTAERKVYATSDEVFKQLKVRSKLGRSIIANLQRR
ncbi:MAG TPA: hypothetical protein VFM18_06430, partial [Methanosarcina sp.]|nr:hypothetical protein [Methanosarcina sp.]